MLEKIISMLNADDFYKSNEYIQIAKGKYEYPKTLKDILVLIKRELHK